MEIYKCGNCTMMFQDPRKLKVLLSKFDDELYSQYFSQLDLAVEVAKTSLLRIENIFKEGLQQVKVLEVGTGRGVLASLFLKKKADYLGIEPSTFFYNDALKNFTELQGKVRNCCLEEAELNKKPFDLVVIIDTLEHIPYPCELLTKLKTYLRPGGVVYIEVPNESLLRCKGFLRRSLNMYSGYPTHMGHVNLFTKSTLKRTLEIVDLDIRNVYQMSILGDYNRMKSVFGNKVPVLIRSITSFFRITKLDLVLQQGNLAAISCKV